DGVGHHTTRGEATGRVGVAAYGEPYQRERGETQPSAHDHAPLDDEGHRRRLDVAGDARAVDESDLREQIDGAASAAAKPGGFGDEPQRPAGDVQLDVESRARRERDESGGEA